MMTDFDIYNHMKSMFDGILVLGDVHSDYECFKKAVAHARSNNYFILSLGDLVDRGMYPYEVVEAMYDLMAEGLAGLVVGNHDDKFRRYAEGARVKLSKDACDTLDRVGKRRVEKFLSMYCEMQSDKMLSGYFLEIDKFIFTHGAYHAAMSDTSVAFEKSARSRAIFGETNGEVDADNYPVRLYNWIDEIPAGMTVMVGHDRKPVHNVEITEPFVVHGDSGGSAIFIDTSCGKGGHLTGAVFMVEKGKYELKEFVAFKE